MCARVSVKKKNPEMDKQMGCMNGLLQLFDRHHFLNGRRVNQKRLPSAHNGNQLAEKNSKLQISTGKNVKEKQRISTESSRTSSSSSSTSFSSFSSLDNSRSAKLEQPLLSQTTFAGIPTQHSLKNQTLKSRKFNQSLDLQDSAKNSMNVEARGLSVKTVTTKPATGHTVKHIDSPRPNQQPKFSERRVSDSNVSWDPLPNTKGGMTRSNVVQVPMCAHRHSYDGRESHDTLKSSIKLKELPRLSLDSREYRARCSASGTRSSDNFTRILSEQQEPTNSKRPSMVIAKLMGLEAFPDSTSSVKNMVNASSSNKPDPFSRSPNLKNGNSTTNLSPSSQLFTTNSLRKTCSVYGEIEKRLATLEFKKSGKDLRALKQILEAMQKTKETLDTERETASDVTSQSRNTNILDNSSELTSPNKRRDKMCSPARAPISPKIYKSPIIIMKPAKINTKANSFASLDQPNQKVPESQMLQNDHFTYSRKGKLNSQILTDLSPRYNNHKKYIQPSQPLSPTEKRASFKAAQVTKVPQHVNGELPAILGTIPVTLSPRLGLKFGLEKPFSSNNPLSDSGTTRSQYVRHKTESCPAKTSLKIKARHWNQNSNAEERKKRNGIRGLTQNENVSSLKSKSIASLAQDIDQKDTSIYQFDKIDSRDPDDYCQQKNSTTRLSRIGQMEEPPMASLEQPSPVSVLDSTFYPDDLSPIKKKLYAFEDDDSLNLDEEEVCLEWETQSPVGIKQLGAEINLKKLENNQNLRKNLSQVNCISEENIMDYSMSLNERINPQHLYITEILLASGHLGAFDSGLESPQLHSSGHWINPKLFFELEQTQDSTWSSDDEGSVNMAKSDSKQKAQKRLVFDTVNEILVGKIEAKGSFKLSLSESMETSTKMKAHKLLKDLCAQVDQLQSTNLSASLNENANCSNMLICDDILRHSKNWIGCQNEVSGLVLDIERLIFKDLITEVVISEADCLQGRSFGYCRRLFSA